MQITLTDYGARLVSVLVPDKQGNLRDVVLGFDHIDAYIKADEPYYGATIGRFANRIRGGQFTLADGSHYQTTPNQGKDTLHGGAYGFHKRVWDRRVNSIEQEISFFLVSPDGEEGFPGTLSTCVTYRLTDDNEIQISYRAETTKTTVINLTNHAYFNLNGEDNETVLDHHLQIFATHYLPTDQDQLPLGVVAPVEQTPFDFLQPKPIGRDLAAENEQLRIGLGYDHCFVLDQQVSKSENGLKIYRAAMAKAPDSGIRLDVWTSEPAMQLYTTNVFSGKDRGKSGVYYVKNCGFALETQHFPDAPNLPIGPGTVLQPDEIFMSETRYCFSVEK